MTGGNRAQDAIAATDWARLSVVVTLGIGIGLFATELVGITPLAQDAWVYWHANLSHLYGSHFAIREAPFVYSPAFAQALEPARALPARHFTALWQVAVVLVLALTIRGWALPLLVIGYILPLPFLSSVSADVALGNINILLGAVAVWGLRWPALWSFALLSKVTPGIGLLWFVARREWRDLGIAIGATAAIAGASFLIAPGLWLDWVHFLEGGQDFPLWVFPVPLWARLALSAALIWWGAVGDRRWVLPIACLWAVPIPYPTLLAGAACALHYASSPMSSQAMTENRAVMAPTPLGLEDG
jgi:Glycosyltransferase family 87